jgi:ATPase subunit of ABC transporter with duplicated ATPase domains
MSLPHNKQEGIPFEGNYSGWLERKAQRLQQEGTMSQTQDTERVGGTRMRLRSIH